MLKVPQEDFVLNSIVLASAKRLVLDRMKLTKPIKLSIESVVKFDSVGGEWVMIWFYYFSSPNAIHPIYYNYAFSMEEWENVKVVVRHVYNA